MSIPSNLSKQLLQLKSDQEVQVIIQDQNECLQMYNDTHKKLDAFNKYSKARYLEVHNHFEIHTKLLKEVKSDLDGVFLKLRKIRTHLSSKYPNEMQTVLEKNPPPIVEDD